MLKSPNKKLLSLVKPTHIELFEENYQLLKQWARRLTEHDLDAEDLLHDTFIQFRLSKPDLDSIHNLEGYLYILMKNLHLSQLRRSTRLPVRSLSAVEFDSVDISLWSSDPRDHLRLRGEIGAICRYACLRKESARTGSVLILRFFHGYYPEEIATLLRSNRSAVEKRLRKARAEARLYIEDAGRLSFIDQKSTKDSAPVTGLFGDDLRLELRKQIFSSCQGECLTKAMYEALYAAGNTEESSLDHRLVAHLVSCPNCLEIVNALLGLPPLANRYPLDMLGKDPGKKGDGPGSSGNAGAGGNSAEKSTKSGESKMLDSYLNRWEAHFHHQPQELCISVNGQLQGFQKVVSGKSELTLIIDTPENLGFVEVFSEQGLRLLMLNVDPPPVGDGIQSAQIELSSGRTVQAKLNFSGVHPALQVTYDDPELALEADLESTEMPDITPTTADVTPLVVPETVSKIESGWTGKFGFKSFSEILKYWLEPARITAVCGVLIIALIGYFYLTIPVEKPLSALDLLTKAAQDETALQANPEFAVHRTYKIEEWSNGTLRSRRRVDDWQKADASARRVFDEQEKMIEGFWQGRNGDAKIFKIGEKLKTVDPASELAEKSLNDKLQPTIADFTSIVEKAGVLSRLKLAESGATYALTYQKETDPEETDPDPPSATTHKLPGELLVASLILDRNDLNPRSETLVLKIGDETREYRFTDVRVERKPVHEVSPLLFFPEAKLLQGETKVDKPVVETPNAVTPETNSNTNINLTNTNTSSLNPKGATLETEVEVMKLLDSVNALSGEQISVARTANGQLKISGIVEGVQRKTEILNALAPVRKERGVVIEIETVEEATARQSAGKSSTVILNRENQMIDTEQLMPVDGELRSLLARRGVPPENIGQEMRAFANSVTAASRVLRRNALALKQIAERFTPAEVERLEPAKREEWKALVRSRARAVGGDIQSLTAQLAQLFPGLQSSDSGATDDVKDAADAASAAQRLFGLASACDSQVSQSFAISGSKGSAPVRSVQFGRNLAQMTSLAAELQKF